MPANVVVLMHGDVWGVLNANQLLPELVKRGCNIHLVISRSTPDEKGFPASKKVPELAPFLAIKENCMLQFFRYVDSFCAAASIFGMAMDQKYLTFNQLAQKFCADRTVHWTTRGGFAGGTEIDEQVFVKLRDRGIQPDLVLSGDTLAILPDSITSRYPCFGTHPGPLPEVPGMHGTERSLLYMQLYDTSGRPYTGDRNCNPGLPMVCGSFFNLRKKLDDGPVIAKAHAMAIPGQTLCEVRAGLYHALIQTMIDHLDILLDPTQRRALVEQKEKEKAAQKHHGVEVPELSSAVLTDWLSQGVIHDDPSRVVLRYVVDGEIVDVGYDPNQIFSHRQMKSWMSGFLPTRHEADFFYGVYNLMFGIDPPQPRIAQVRRVYTGPNVLERLIGDLEKQRVG